MESRNDEALLNAREESKKVLFEQKIRILSALLIIFYFALCDLLAVFSGYKLTQSGCRSNFLLANSLLVYAFTPLLTLVYLRNYRKGSTYIITS